MGTRLYRSREDRMIAGVAGGSRTTSGWTRPWSGWSGSCSSWPAGSDCSSTSSPGSWCRRSPSWAELGVDLVLGRTTSPGAPAGTAVGTPPVSPATAAPSIGALSGTRIVRRVGRPGGNGGGDGRTASLLVGGFLILIGFGFLLRGVRSAIDFDLFWPLVLVILGVLILAAALRPRGPSDTTGTGSGCDLDSRGPILAGTWLIGLGLVFLLAGCSPSTGARPGRCS